MSPTVEPRSKLARWLWRDHPLDFGAGFPETGEDHRAFLRAVNDSAFNWLVFIVAASGFLTDAYNLFSSNVILPALSYVYHEETEFQFTFNAITLAASAVGQVVFGIAADVYGRKALYGVELLIVIISTIGLLQCSRGYVDPLNPQRSTWDITGWLLFWRCIMGFGIGAEYPLSACIAAEWSSTRSRGRMMAAVFLMQPLGQLCAYGAGLTALRWTAGNSRTDIDMFWRYVIGIGCLPTLVALAFRLYMPESGRYIYDVERKYKRRTDTDSIHQADAVDREEPVMTAKNDLAKGTFNQFQMDRIRRFLFDRNRNWNILLGTSMCWLLLDIAFYGLGFNNPSVLSKLWASKDLIFMANGTTPSWFQNSILQPDRIDITDSNNVTSQLRLGDIWPDNVESTPLIKAVLRENMTTAIYTVSISSILGLILLIFLINKLDRKQTLTVTFLILAGLLFVACGSFEALFHQPDRHVLLIVLWVAISFFFSFGPNTLTFIIPAEVFPTEYRCTFYGIAAAAGKIGSVIAQALARAVRPSQSERNGLDAGTSNTNFRWLLLCFGICMLFGAVFSHLCIPRVQRRLRTSPKCPLVNISLEELAEGSKATTTQEDAEMGERQISVSPMPPPTPEATCTETVELMTMKPP